MVVFPHPSAPPCVCLCLSTYLHLSSCPRRPPLPLRVCLCLFVSVWVCLRLSSCPRRPLACLSLSLCVCLCLSVSVYVSASFFVSPPRVSVCVFVSVWLCLRLPAHLRLSSCPRRPSPPAACLSACLCVCLCLSTYRVLSLVPGRNSKVCGGGGTRPQAIKYQVRLSGSVPFIQHPGCMAPYGGAESEQSLEACNQLHD